MIRSVNSLCTGNLCKGQSDLAAMALPDTAKLMRQHHVGGLVVKLPHKHHQAYGTFQRTIPLPRNVYTDNAEASY